MHLEAAAVPCAERRRDPRVLSHYRERRADHEDTSAVHRGAERSGFEISSLWFAQLQLGDCGSSCPNGLRFPGQGEETRPLSSETHSSWLGHCFLADYGESAGGDQEIRQPPNLKFSSPHPLLWRGLELWCRPVLEIRNLSEVKIKNHKRALGEAAPRYHPRLGKLS